MSNDVKHCGTNLLSPPPFQLFLITLTKSYCKKSITPPPMTSFMDGSVESKQDHLFNLFFYSQKKNDWYELWWHQKLPFISDCSSFLSDSGLPFGLLNGKMSYIRHLKNFFLEMKLSVHFSIPIWIVIKVFIL